MGWCWWWCEMRLSVCIVEKRLLRGGGQRWVEVAKGKCGWVRSRVAVPICASLHPPMSHL